MQQLRNLKINGFYLDDSTIFKIENCLCFADETDEENDILVQPVTNDDTKLVVTYFRHSEAVAIEVYDTALSIFELESVISLGVKKYIIGECCED